MEQSLQETPHEIKRRILYKNPASEMYRQHIDPGAVLTFPHLSDAEIMLLQRKGVIKPLSEQEVKDKERNEAEDRRLMELAIKAAEEEESDRQKVIEQQKKAAA